MEKTKIEIELTEAENAELDRLIEYRCLDKGKWLRRLVTDVVRNQLKIRKLLPNPPLDKGVSQP